MADVWAQAPVETTITTIKASIPQGGGPQEVGKYTPEKDMLKWGVKFGVNPQWSNLFTNEPPKEGDPVKVWEYWKEENGEKKFVKWFLDADYQRIKGARKGGGYPAGMKPNYSLEQEAMRDGQKAAIDALCGGLEGKDGMMKLTLPNIRLVASALAKDIVDAGKKPETPQS
jgi:hypothetical protein